MATDTIPARLFRNETVRPHRPAYYVKQGAAWRATTWSGFAREVRQAGKALQALGLGKGSSVGILGFNRPEWTIADLACMCIGGAPAGIYTTCSGEEVKYILTHCEAPVAFVEDHDQWQKIAAHRDQLPKLKYVVTFKGVPKIEDGLVLTWDEFMARGADTPDAVFEQAVAALEPADLATLIYTSGTTGPPKGVMLSHENLAWTAQTLNRLIGSNQSEVSLSYLPLSHIAEQMVSIHGPATGGGCVYYAESIDKVPDNLKEVRPTLMFGVPRIWEKFHAGIAAKLGAATGGKAKLVAWARGVATQVNAAKTAGREPSKRLQLQYEVARRLVFDKLKEALGLDRGRNFVSGAAPIGKEVLEFFASLDIVVQEVYGQSEDSGPTTLNVRGRTRFGTVGPPIPGVEVKLAEDEEILVKGPNVFMGYYKDPEATAATLTDGWLRSGDLGKFDRDGFVTIIGRKKEIIITSGGKNITPKNIEASLKNCPLVSEAVVIGDRRKFLTALITLDEDAAAKVAGGRGAPHESAAVRAEIQKAVDETNRTLARVETVKKFAILPRNLTVEDGELTPTLKVKRRVVDQNFKDQIEQMYRD